MIRWLWTSSLFIASGVVGLGYLWTLYRKRENEIPTKWERAGIVENLLIYPLKSGSLIELEEASCTELGLQEVGVDKKYFLRDRCFVVYQTSDHQVVNLKKISKMVLISLRIVDDVLQFRAPNSDDFKLKLSSVIESPRCVKIYLYGGEFETADCGDEVAKWMSQYLMGSDEGLRLGCYVENFVERPNTRKRTAENNKQILSTYGHWRDIDSGLYADLTSYLIVNSASVDYVNSQLPSEDHFSYKNLRPNIVIQGDKEYAEDTWKWIKFGDGVIMRTVKPCTRCVAIMINQQTAERNKNMQPLKILKSYRTLKQVKGLDVEGDYVAFGINAGLYSTGRIKIGDPVYVSI